MATDKPQYAYERISPNHEGKTHFRIHDARDNALCFCYLEDHARQVVRALNAPTPAREPVAWKIIDERFTSGGILTQDRAEMEQLAKSPSALIVPLAPLMDPPTAPTAERSEGAGVADIVKLYAMRDNAELDAVLADAVRRGLKSVEVPNGILGTIRYELPPTPEAGTERSEGERPDDGKTTTRQMCEFIARSQERIAEYRNVNSPVVLVEREARYLARLCRIVGERIMAGVVSSDDLAPLRPPEAGTVAAVDELATRLEACKGFEVAYHFAAQPPVWVVTDTNLDDAEYAAATLLEALTMLADTYAARPAPGNG